MQEFKEVPSVQRVLVRSVCDKCGAEIKHDRDYFLNTDFKVSYEYSAWGDWWIDYGWEIEDLCLECCKKLQKLLEDNGYKLKDIT